MNPIYRENQFEVILDYVKIKPDWLILGGPADGNEAQCAVKHWPDLMVLGCEPIGILREYQLNNGWPRLPDTDTPLLLPYALSDKTGNVVIKVPLDNPRCASLMPDRPGTDFTVETTTIDVLESYYGPFTNCILWLDIEGYELEALRGAVNLLNSGKVLAVNVEVLDRRPEVTKEIDKLLHLFGLILVKQWNIHKGTHHDRIYTSRRCYTGE